MKRVVVTGMAGISPIGSDWKPVRHRLEKMDTGIVRMDDWDQYEELNTRLGAPVPDFEMPPHFRRKDLRSMGRVAQLAVRSSELALEDAGLAPAGLVRSRTGVFVGVTEVDYGRQTLAALDQIDVYAGTGNGQSFTAGRLSYVLGLQGPSQAVDTACSSSLACSAVILSTVSMCTASECP